MSFLEILFGKKPSNKDIVAFNYNLFFDFIPKRLAQWEKQRKNISFVLSFDTLIQQNNIWKSLVKKITITESTLKKSADVTLYLIKAPSTEGVGEVAMAIFAVNPKTHRYIYYTMEYSLGTYGICTTEENGNHYFMDNCKNGEEFGAYVIKHAKEELIPKTPAATKKAEPKPSAPASRENHTKHTAESFLNTLEKIANQYYDERGVVSINDWMVTKKEDESFKFYITQYPDAEFEDSNCEVTLMVDFMDHNGRMEVVNKFFPKKNNDVPPLVPAPKPSNGKYFTIDQIRQIPLGGLRLQPLDAGIVFDSQQQEIVKLMASRSPRIKKYLPNLDLSSNEAIAKYFTTLCMKTEMGLEFGYSIKLSQHGDLGYLGFIFVHTPALNEVAINFPHWTVDFCMFEGFEGRSFMRGCLKHVLKLLKEQMNVADVFAIVDSDNERCLRLMQFLPFELRPEVLTDSSTGKKAKLFRCDLKEFNL